jgi:hypothetical protein
MIPESHHKQRYINIDFTCYVIYFKTTLFVMLLSREETCSLLWTQLQNSKYKEFQLNLLQEKFQKRDRLLNLFLVVVTSSSVSAWAIWKAEYLNWVWAGLIAVSQIVTLIKPYFNYSKHAKEISEKYFLLQALNIEYEKLWLNFKFEKILPELAFEKAFELKTSLSKALTFSDDVIITVGRKIEGEAKKQLLNYLVATFNYTPKTLHGNLEAK